MNDKNQKKEIIKLYKKLLNEMNLVKKEYSEKNLSEKEIEFLENLLQSDRLLRRSLAEFISFSAEESVFRNIKTEKDIDKIFEKVFKIKDSDEIDNFVVNKVDSGSFYADTGNGLLMIMIK